MNMRSTIVGTLLVFSLPAFAESGLSIDWEWKTAHRCTSMSPSFEIAGIPEEVVSFEITMVDQDASHFDHGGGTFSHVGGATVTIPEAALKSYKGPCPPNFSSFGHDYTFTVRALAADGKTELAMGSKTKTFSARAVKQ